MPLLTVECDLTLTVKPVYTVRPFPYAIVKENTILFLGRFVKPVAEKPFVAPGLTGGGRVFNRRDFHILTLKVIYEAFIPPVAFVGVHWFQRLCSGANR